MLNRFCIRTLFLPACNSGAASPALACVFAPGSGSRGERWSQCRRDEAGLELRADDLPSRCLRPAGYGRGPLSLTRRGVGRYRVWGRGEPAAIPTCTPSLHGRFTVSIQ